MMNAPVARARYPFRDSDQVEGLCRRCAGMGGFEQYRHVEGGVCFRCNGTRRETITFATAKRRAARSTRHHDHLQKIIERERRRQDTEAVVTAVASEHRYDPQETVTGEGDEVDRLLALLLAVAPDSARP